MTVEDLRPPTVTLGDVGAALRRRWWVSALGLLLGLGAGAGYAYSQPLTTTAFAQAQVNVIVANPFGNSREPSGLIDAATEIQTARSSDVASATAAALGGDWTITQVRDALVAEVLPNSTVVRIAFTADDPEQAIAGADEAVSQFLRFRGESAAARVERITQRLTSMRNNLRDDLARVNTELSSTPENTPRRAALEADADAIRTELSALTTQSASIAAVDVTGGQLISGASDSRTRITPQRPLLITAGGLAGLLGGATLAALLGLFERRAAGRDTIERAGAGPLLGMLRSRKPSAVLDADEQDTIRGVWARLSAHVPDGGTVAVIDLCSTPTDVASRLAVQASRRSKATRLVLEDWSPDDVDMLSRALGWQVRNGGLVAPADPSLTVRIGAKDDGRPLERGFTIIGHHGAAGRGARLEVSKSADAVLLVAARNKTRVADLSQTAADLAAVHVPIRGTLLVPRSRRLVDHSEVAEHQDDLARSSARGSVRTPLEDAGQLRAVERSAGHVGSREHHRRSGHK